MDLKERGVKSSYFWTPELFKSVPSFTDQCLGIYPNGNGRSRGGKLNEDQKRKVARAKRKAKRKANRRRAY